MTAPRAVADVVASASGREHRADPILPATGGPGGNAALTAWIGLVLLVLFLAELVTLLNVKRLVSWHIAIGVLLIPPALAKTFSTGWRIVRYYSGARPYRQAGPPPFLLRLLGPLVVLSTLAVLGSGLALIPIGPVTTFMPLFSVAGQRISALTIHQASFIGWGVTTGLHVLARTVPALRLAAAPRPGRWPARQRARSSCSPPWSSARSPRRWSWYCRPGRCPRDSDSWSAPMSTAGQKGMTTPRLE